MPEILVEFCNRKKFKTNFKSFKRTLVMENFTIGEVEKRYLSRAARWAKLYAVVSFIMIGFFFLMSLTMLIGGRIMAPAMAAQGLPPAFATWYGASFLVVCVAVFFMALYVFLFAVRTQTAITQGNQEQMTSALENLSKFFWMTGMIIVVSLAMCVVGMVVGIFAAAVGAI